MGRGGRACGAMMGRSILRASSMSLDAQPMVVPTHMPMMVMIASAPKKTAALSSSAEKPTSR